MLNTPPMPSRPRSQRSLMLPWLTAFAVALLLVFAAGTASAQKIALTAGYPLRVNNEGRIAVAAATTNPGDVNVGINRATCLDTGAHWNFSFQLPVGVAFSDLQIWVTDGNKYCSDVANRLTVKSCFQVASFKYADVFGKIVSVPDAALIGGLASQQDIPDYNNPDRAKICNPSASQEPQPFYINYLLLNGAEIVGGATSSNPYESSTATTFDLRGPDPPSGITLGPGDSLLVAGLTPVGTTTNLKGYQAYCWPLPGAVVDGGTTTTTKDIDAGLDGSSGDASDASDASDDGALADGASEATAPDGSSETGGTAPIGVCPSFPADFAIGLLPNPAYACSGIFGATSTSVKITGLTNGVHYGVAVAGVDTYQNPGALSQVVCDTPVQTTDFYDDFREAGGTAGGGYCSLGAPTGQTAGAVAIALGALGLVLRRRRSARAR